MKNILNRRRTVVASLVGALAMALAIPVLAGSPHFVGKIKATINGNTLVVSGKEAGLGNETQVSILVTALAECVNRGGNKPSADNKDEFSAEGQFPVQNGKALFELVVVASFQPDCSPPMTVEWSNIVVQDIEHGLIEFL